jgi:hypothetical protein
MMDGRTTTARNTASTGKAMLLLAFLLEHAGCSLKSTPGTSDPGAPPPGGAVLSVSQNHVDLGDRSQSNASFLIRNSGEGQLDYDITVDSGNGAQGWLTATPSSGSSSGENDIASISTFRDLLQPGAYSGTVHVASGGQTANVNVALAVVGVQLNTTNHDFAYGNVPYAMQVWNSGGGVLSFNVTSRPSWLRLDKVVGTSAGPKDKKTLVLSIDRYGLLAGHYSGTVKIESDEDQGDHDMSLDVEMDVASTGGILDVDPAGTFQSSGFVGGPFSPASTNYTLSNTGDASLDWTATATQSWVALSAQSGTLAAGGSTTVTVSIDQNDAGGLSPQAYHDDVAFANTTNGFGDASRGVDLVVNDPSLQASIYVTPNTMKIAPYTTLFSALDSKAGANPIVKWNWDFGDTNSVDPATDEGLIVAHRFDNVGTYTIKLTVVDSTGATASATTTLTTVAFSGTDYYISSSTGSDSNDGKSSARPFKTINYAFSKMKNRTDKDHPDRLFFLRGDTWTVASVNPVPTPSILDAYGTGAQPLISFTTDAGLVWYANDDWGWAPIFQNLHVKYTTQCGAFSLIGSYIHYGGVARNCTIENGGVKGAPGFVLEDCDVSYGLQFGYFSGGSDQVIRRTRLTANGHRDMFENQIYLSNGYRWLVEDTIVDGRTYDGYLNNEGMKLNGGNGVRVRRCEAYANHQGIGCYKNSEEVGDGRPDPSDYYIEDCVVRNNGNTGQYAGIDTGWIKKITIRNCTFYNNDPGGTPDGGAISLEWNPCASNDIRIYNCTFYSNELPDVAVNCFKDMVKDGQTSVPLNVKMRNNVFVRDSSVGGFVYLIDSNWSTPTFDSDYNVFFWKSKAPSDPTFALKGKNGDTSLDTWKSVKGKDTHSKWSDPLFSDAAHFDFTLLEGSPAIDAGIALPDVWRDKLWVARPRGPSHDCGVFEK